jgi:hypothetical protein
MNTRKNYQMSNTKRIEQYLNSQQPPGWLTVMDIVKALDIPPASVRRTLRALRDQGKAEYAQPWEQNTLRWRSTEFLSEEKLQARLETIANEIRMAGMNMFDEYIDQAVNGHGYGGSDDSAVVTIPVKLSRNQVAHMRASGETDSQWVREAVQMRIERGE